APERPLAESPLDASSCSTPPGRTGTWRATELTAGFCVAFAARFPANSEVSTPSRITNSAATTAHFTRFVCCSNFLPASSIVTFLGRRLRQPLGPIEDQQIHVDRVRADPGLSVDFQAGDAR